MSGAPKRVCMSFWGIDFRVGDFGSADSKKYAFGLSPTTASASDTDLSNVAPPSRKQAYGASHDHTSPP